MSALLRRPGGRRAAAALGAVLLVGLGLALQLGGDRVRGRVVIPQGPPAERHGEAPLATLARVENARSRLVTVGELYTSFSVPDARAHLTAARGAYAPLAGAVRARDATLARELDAAFHTIDGLLRDEAPIEDVTRRVSLLRGQLFEAVVGLLVPDPVRADAGTRAEVLSRLVERLGRSYAAGVTRPPEEAGAAADRAARRSFQRAYGLMARSQAIAAGLSLDQQKEAVVESLRLVRQQGFPLGVVRPPVRPPPGPVAALARRVQEGLDRRFAL